MPGHKLTKTLLWVSTLLDAFILLGLATKVVRNGISGLSGWFRHVHLLPVSAANGEAIYQLQPDYRFTAFYAAAIIGAFALSFSLPRLYLKSRRVPRIPVSGTRVLGLLFLSDQ